MKVLILGASSQLFRTVIKNKFLTNTSELILIEPNVNIRYGDVIPEEYLDDIDAIINFAFYYNRDYRKALLTNVEGTLHWIDQLGKRSSALFLQVSSDSVRFNPQSKYSKIKIRLENEILNLPNVRVLRIPTLIGNFVPPPSSNFFEFIKFQERALNKVLVPERFYTRQVLQYLDSLYIWDALYEATQNGQGLQTLISHEPGQFFSLMDIWEIHRELLHNDSKGEMEFRGIGTHKLANFLNFVTKQETYWFRKLEAILPFL